MQCFRMIHFSFWAADNYHNTVGRFDQYMWPYLEADLKNGVLTEDEALALLEEFFFRGFAFLTLRRFFSAKFAYLYSAVVFAVYHVSILQGWFSPALYALAMAGLAAGGLLFDWLDSRTGSLLPSYFVHMSANLAINTVGLILFGFIG